MPRKIIHIDLDAFFCAVEEVKNPELVGKAFAVGGRPNERGVIASCSYPARAFGVRSAMPTSRALRLCPQLILVSSRYSDYSHYSELMAGILSELTPLVEQISIDEAFIDVSDLPEAPEQIARKLQERVHRDLKLPCSLGVGTNKLIAKIANDFGKSTARKGLPPNAITVVAAGKEAEFLASLPVDRLWGVGPKTSERLNQLGIQTIGQLADFPESALSHEFGKNGHDLVQRARGIDDSPIVTWHEPKSISQETTFARDVRDPEQLIRVIRSQSEQVGARLRKHRYTATTVKIKLRWPDFTTLTRQISSKAPIDQDEEIFSAALSLLNKTWETGKPVRLIGVGVSGLGETAHQLQLWDEQYHPEAASERRLQEALDQLRNRYGKKVIRRASELKGKD